MKTIYDISVLGASQYDQRSRTGIYRVVERVACGLAQSAGCDLSFSSMKCLEGSIDYWSQHPELQSVPFARAESSRKLCRGLYRLNSQMAARPLFGRRYLPLRIVRSLLYRTEGMMERLESSRDSEYMVQSDIFHSPFFALPEPSAKRGGPRRFLTVYDLTPILFPHFFAYDEDELIRSILASIGPDDWVLCISDSCRQDLCDFLEIDPARVFVTHLAADPEQFYPCRDAGQARRVRKKYGIPEAPYVLALSTLQPRKNLDHVIRCFGRLIEEEGMKDLHLVLVGIRGWHDGPIFDAIEALGPLKDRVIVTGFVEDDDLAPLYSGAMVFVYPSFYEGFGLPPLEAMQCGVPVIASNTSSLPEVIGDAGVMVSPTDADGLCQAMLELYERRSLRERMSAQSLEQARSFSWQRCTQQTMDAYEASLAGRPWGLPVRRRTRVGLGSRVLGIGGERSGPNTQYPIPKTPGATP